MRKPQPYKFTTLDEPINSLMRIEYTIVSRRKI